MRTSTTSCASGPCPTGSETPIYSERGSQRRSFCRPSWSGVCSSWPCSRTGLQPRSRVEVRPPSRIGLWQTPLPLPSAWSRSGPSSTGSVITFDPDGLATRAAELEAKMGEPGFWDDQQGAAAISTEHARIAKRLERYERLRREYDDARELLAMDGDMASEIETSLEPLEQELELLQEDALFSGEYDAGDAVVTIQSDAGGTDAQDFTEMLLRMYLRWAADRGFKTDVLEASPGEEAGLKSATFTIEGENAYGILKAERGKHRLVRLSPYDSAHRRHTSFAQVIPSPFLTDDAEIEVDESEIRVDTYRASGAGGQHVNKTDSAVRITHL